MLARSTGCSACRASTWPGPRPPAVAAPPVRVTWPSPAFGGVLGACHGLDVRSCSVRSPRVWPACVGIRPAAEAVELSPDAGGWTALARDGDPGWPAYDEQQRLTRVFDTGERGGVRAYPEETSRQLWAGAGSAVVD